MTAEWLKTAQLIKQNQELIAERTRCKVLIDTVDKVIANNQEMVSNYQQKMMTTQWEENA